MGGSSGGSLLGGDLKDLEERVKQRIAQSQKSVRHVFISFDHEDIDEVNLLRGQAKNDKVDLQFDDHSIKEPYDSDNAKYIRQKISEKIEHCSVTVVYLTDRSSASDWVNWEISESIRQGKGVIGVYKGDHPPRNLPRAFSSNNCRAVKWDHEALMKAIHDASTKR